ncbi:MAG: (d)CMP kinase [Hyphomicrobiales bacterium]|nr:MAG: (d)CMP kinase [Hyphomicrobiales bacterium]
MLIAIDGPAAAGKGTLARRLAAHYGLAFLDTGSLYRAVGCRVLEEGGDPADAAFAARIARALDMDEIDETHLRTAEAGAAASKVAVIPAVRQALLDFQRSFAARDGGAVLDGRDIGTVVAPHADVKLFVTASPEERARRRYEELKLAGAEVDQGRILDEIIARDARDSGRADAPLRAADDAHLLDTTKLDIEAAFRMAVSIIDRAMEGSVS